MRKLLLYAAALSLPAIAACTVHQDTAPSVSGPAEAALSLRLVANPDHVPQDGSQSSRIAVTAFDAGGRAIAVLVHLDVQPAGFGTLSTDINGNLTTSTDASRPTTVSYLPPASTTGNATNVTIFATMVGPDSVANSTQQVSVSVMPATTVSNAAPTAVVVLNPETTNSSYVTGQSIGFDGSTSCGSAIVAGVCTNTSAITGYVWNFGDNSASVTGATATHAYAAGTFAATLTVTNAQGLSSSKSRTITAGAVAAPTASFVFSPTTIHKAIDTVQFNAAGSRAATGHTIVRYDWNFGDSVTDTKSVPTTTHLYTATAGIGTTTNTYVVTLTVTDDLGQVSTLVSQNVIVLN